MGTSLENKLYTGKSNPGVLNGSNVGEYENPLRDRLIYLTMCLIGYRVEVQLKNGSIYSGIFHATNAENDFGIILKMARLTKDCSFKGQKPISDSTSKAPSKTLIIPAKELVQVIAKGVPLTWDGLTSGVQRERRQDIMTDSLISQSQVVEVERELEHWTPDEDGPQCPELESIFDNPWNRNWDQFEANKSLFGVKSTFNEEFYTTKLERGPHMRELEREATRIAREIENEETHDLHLAEERGLNFHDDYDEEARFSSVLRGVDDSGYEESEDSALDSHNSDTFGASSGSVISRSFSDVVRGKTNDGTHASSSSSLMDEAQFTQLNTGRDLCHFGSGDLAKQLPSDFVSKSFTALEGENRLHENRFREQNSGNNFPKDFEERKNVSEEVQPSKLEDAQSTLNLKKAISDKGGLSPSATAYDPSSSLHSKGQDCEIPFGKASDSTAKEHDATQPVNSQGRPGSSTSSTSECVGGTSALSGPGLPPTSSMGSLSLGKSTLNPHAKEFKLNPNAKSFIPSQTPLRPSSPGAEGSFYLPPNATAVQHIHGLPVGIGIQPSFGHQPVIYNPQTASIQSPQAYIHPSAPVYGQQMILGHPRQFLYMPSYPHEMPYKGSDF
ncbi:PREDICTED: polyadenylate-binding protein-interacting protein 4-like isoform X2 [Nelumbo nucifera]|uniref:Polyadenylate-binding protein-interacting protein 4-like isoform X2 n=1 Tax=Nelumbo nucifera TaxID=4432 RepID=A0A1U8B3T2_NELNU|nr:PREDICTED: polyadenylate-binding protein-interacting protein 4-like isoform X2 [Nelumbo nucifera]